MQTTTLWWRALLVVAVLGAAIALLVFRPIRLGLDLRGGTQIVMEARVEQGTQLDDETIDRTVEVLRRRVDALGVAEPTLQRSGDRRIIVELPGVTDPEEAVEVIGRTAQLTFHPVLASSNTAAEGSDGETAPADTPVMDEDGAPVRLGRSALDGSAVGGAQAVTDPSGLGSWHVEIEFQGTGDDAWAQLTGDAACAAPGDPQRRVAIVLDEEVITSPEVSPEVACDGGISGGNTVITGQFGAEEARDLALLIRAGALPVPIDVAAQTTVGPTLGAEAIASSTRAAVIGASLTVLFMIAAYRLLGVIAAAALVCYALLSLAVLVGVGATLTLPGIAGFVLAIGMAVDANVLVFERAKEEHADGRRTRRAVTTGFTKAWSAIIDSNVTTLLAAVLLIFFASGAVRGFGVTLAVGVVVSMVSALVIARLLADVLLRLGPVARSPSLLGLATWGSLRRLLSPRGRVLITSARAWVAVGGVTMAIAFAAVVFSGLDYGLDFSGGRLIEFDTQRAVDVDELRRELAAEGLDRAVVQITGDDNVTVRTGELSSAERSRATATVAQLSGSAGVVRDEFIGPTIGAELRRGAAIAIGLALLMQLLYVTVRFKWSFAVSAITAMVHDVAILLAVFAVAGKTIDGVFIAALLTVIGYSINDSVVIFDRIREQLATQPRRDVAEVANEACLETLPRTVNTGLGALFILVTLYVLGGETLRDFAFALILGILVGTYSSVFTATPLAVILHRRTRS